MAPIWSAGIKAMSDFAIRAEKLSKSYKIRHAGAGYRYQTLQESLLSLPRRILGRKETSETFWALKDVSFEVKQGERLGIIGRNGAGKSTLLKLLSRITEPTSGQAIINGRVASLLEVGTGFHQELTGRENIFMNGAILGMSRSEIRKKFDEIVAFAEVEQFLDTPVKRYSSGMYVRLAFAVAAHLEPEILLVDEVLAVGDAQFQKKCLGKMQEVSKQEGRTVLFVSHNMAAVEQLCTRGIVLDKGAVAFGGTQSEAIARYLSMKPVFNTLIYERIDRQGTGEIRMESIELRDADGRLVDTVQSGQTICLHFHYKVHGDKQYSNVLMGFLIKTSMDVPVFLQHNRLTGDTFGVVPKKGTFICTIENLPLPASEYQLYFSIMPNNGLGGDYYDTMDNALPITVVGGNFFGSGELPPITHGVCLVPAKWSIKERLE
jgi:lipopolysaccharide transport system ATP-binding protein